MCRLLGYIGSPALLAEVVLWPDRSIVIQSFDARERLQDPSLPQHVGFGNLNGDGFGIGWFSDSIIPEDTKPCVFTSVTPAWWLAAQEVGRRLGVANGATAGPRRWSNLQLKIFDERIHFYNITGRAGGNTYGNNENLNRLALKIRSPLMFAHVRAAYPGMPVSEQNCHPFMFNNYLWMHNGVIAGFAKVRRRLAMMLSDEAFNAVPSLMNSDSAMAFAMFLNNLPDMDSELPSSTLLKAIEATIATICQVTAEAGIVSDSSLLNFVVSDGHAMIATRFVSKESDNPPSLYYAEGWSFEKVSQDGVDPPGTPPKVPSKEPIGSLSGKNEYALTCGVTGSKIVMVASEPITKSCTDWVKVPHNSALVVTREKGDFVNVIRSPLKPQGVHPVQEEIARCLEAVEDGRRTSGRLWEKRLGAGEDGVLPLKRNPVPRPPGLLVEPPHLPTSSATEHDRPAHTLTGHNKAVTCLLSHAGRLYSASADCSIQVWETQDLRWLKRLEGHQKPVTDMQILGSCLLTAAGRTVRLWDLVSLENVQVIHLGQLLKTGACNYTGGVCRAVAVGSDGRVYIGAQDSNVSIYDTAGWVPESPSMAAEPDTQSDTAKALAVALPCVMDKEPVNCYGGSLSVNSSVCTADPAFPTPAADVHIVGHAGAVNALVIANGCLYTCGSDAMIRVMSLETLQTKATMRGHRGSVLCLAAAGDLLLSGGRDNTIRVWDTDTLACRRTLQGHKHDVLSLATLGIAPNLCSGQPPPAAQGSRVPFLFASASADGSARLWCSRDWVCFHVFTPASSAVNGMRPPRMNTSLLGHNPAACMNCTPGMPVAAATTQALNRHRASANGGPAPPVERSLHALKGLVLTPRSLVVANMSGLIHIYPMDAIYDQAVAEFLKANTLDDRKWGAANGSSTTSPANGDGKPAKKRKFLVQNTSDKALLDTLRELIAIPSVSADKRLSDECFRGAKFIAKQLETLGAEVKMTQVMEGKNPVVIGRLGHNPAVPTVTFYGHYDVQPALEEGWKTNPFQMTSIDGYLYGRGTSDNKGPILGFIFAVKELLDECTSEGRDLPVNCAFCLEGEEENGSHGFAATLQANQHWFTGTKCIVVSNTLWIGENKPCLTYGMRGLICLDVRVTGLKRDLHSGNDGGVFNEPMVDLVNVIGTLVDGRNNITIPGFADNIHQHREDLEIWSNLEMAGEFNLDRYKEHLGVPALKEQRSIGDLLYERWCIPSLSIVDIRAGDIANEEGGQQNEGCYRFGPTRFSVIPHCAAGKISIRFVPKQSHEHLVECAKNHLQHEFAKLRTSNKLEVRVRNVGDWWEADTAGQLFKIADRAIEREWGQRPLHVREGGTMPMVATLEKTLGAPAILLPFGQSSDNPHLENERIRGMNLMRGKNMIKHFLQEVAEKMSA